MIAPIGSSLRRISYAVGAAGEQGANGGEGNEQLIERETGAGLRPEPPGSGADADVAGSQRHFAIAEGVVLRRLFHLIDDEPLLRVGRNIRPRARDVDQVRGHRRQREASGGEEVDFRGESCVVAARAERDPIAGAGDPLLQKRDPFVLRRRIRRDPEPHRRWKPPGPARGRQALVKPEPHDR